MNRHDELDLACQRYAVIQQTKSHLVMALKGLDEMQESGSWRAWTTAIDQVKAILRTVSRQEGVALKRIKQLEAAEMAAGEPLVVDEPTAAQEM